MQNNRKKIRRPFIYALIVSIAIGSFFCFARFANIYPFGQEKTFVKGPSTIKIDVFSDLHAVAKGGSGTVHLGTEYEDFLEKFLLHTQISRSNFVVLNGDLIEGTRQPLELGILEIKLTKEFAEKMTQEKAFIIGNHDLRSLTRVQWKEALDIDYLDKSFEEGEYKIIILDSNYGSEGKMNDSDAMDTGLLLSDAQMSWLENELKNSDKIKIVFMHHPPITGSDVKPGYVPRGAAKIRELFSKYGVAAVFSGHTERLAHQKKDGVDYYVFPGPTKFDLFPGAYESIRMIDKKAIVTIFTKNENGEYVSKKVE